MPAVTTTTWRGDISPRFNARMAGLLMLVTLVTGFYAEGFISGQLLGRHLSGMAARVVTHADMVRLGFALYLVEMACSVASSALFYLLLRPVSRSLALAALCLDLVGSTVKTGGRLFFVAPLMVAANPGVAQLLGPDTTGALSYLLLRLTDRAAEMGLVFFGFSGLITGYLTFRSGFLPRVLGAIGMVASVGWMLYLNPPFARGAFPLIAGFGGLGFLALIVWLLVAGVNEERWNERAGIVTARS